MNEGKFGEFHQVETTACVLTFITIVDKYCLQLYIALNTVQWANMEIQSIVV